MRRPFLLLFLPVVFAACAAPKKPQVFYPAKRMVVISPVADVRSQPIPHSGRYEYDPLQETQVVKGEPVLVLERAGEWVRAQCVEQLEFTHNARWEGYPGWIEAKHLSADASKQTRLVKLSLPEENLRERVLAAAARHLGSPYLWGGRSLHDPAYAETATGVDCSGLVNWSFRQIGWLVPRDAHEQFMKARPLESRELKWGDLIFSANAAKPEKVVHVAFYAGEERILEAPQSGEKVRRILFQEKYGAPLAQLKNGAHVGDQVIYFGSLFDKREGQ